MDASVERRIAGCDRPPLVFVCLGIFGENVNELSYGE